MINIVDIFIFPFSLGRIYVFWVIWGHPTFLPRWAEAYIVNIIVFSKKEVASFHLAQAHLERHPKYQCIHVHNLMTIYIGRNQVEIRSLAPLVCFMTIWCKQFQGLSPSKRNGRGFTTNSAGVTKRRSQVDIFIVVIYHNIRKYK